jgi:Flp pilus assembly pilin Flp
MNQFIEYLKDDGGAVSVDYTVLSAAAVGVAIAATAVLVIGIDTLTGRVDAELRDRQLNDEFIGFLPAHFNQLFDAGIIDENDALALWTVADTRMNQQLIDTLVEGITKIEDDTITNEELAELYAAASVAYQRNIVDDAVLEYYFGFDDGVADGYVPPENVACNDPVSC